MHDTVLLLEPDAEQLGRYVNVIFKHATPETIVSLRAFPPEAGKKPIFIRPFPIEDDGLDYVIQGAIYGARDAAKVEGGAVFAPPVATFRDHRSASFGNLAEGVVISVECDERAQQALVTLTAILGPPTLVVASGGIWRNPETGLDEDKLHLYWRLEVPAGDIEGFAKLTEALKLATGLVGADASNTIVHPLRWPGSWHLKAAPRLCRIVEENDVEVNLDTALELLRKAAPPELLARAASEAKLHRDAVAAGSTGRTHTPLNRFQMMALPDINEVASAVHAIPNDDRPRNEWNSLGMAIFASTGGSEEGYAIFLKWSAKSSKHHNPGTVRARWEGMRRSPPTRTGWGKILAMARANGWQPKLKIGKAAPQEEADGKAEVERKPALTFDQGVTKVGEKMMFFLDHIVIGKERNFYIDYAAKTKLDDKRRRLQRELQRAEAPAGPKEAYEHLKRREKAVKRIKAEMDRLELPPRAWAIIGPPGLWKSSTARRLIVERLNAGLLHKVIVMVQTLDFADEYQREFAKLGIRAEILRGRTDKDDKHGPANCQAMDKVDFAQDIGAKVSDFVCKACVFKDNCLYMATMQLEPQVWICASNYLFFEQEVLKDADLLLIDEGFHSRGIVDDIIRYSVPFKGTDRTDVSYRNVLLKVLQAQKRKGGVRQDAISKAFGEPDPDKPDRIVGYEDTLWEAERAERNRLDQELLPRLKKLLEAAGSKTRQVMQSQLVRDIQLAQTMIKIYRELRTFSGMEIRGDDQDIRSGRVLIDEIEDEDDDDDEDNISRLLLWRGLSNITEQFRVPTLLLNVEHEAEIIKTIIPQIEGAAIIDVALPDAVKVTQVFGAPTTKTKLGDPKKKKHESNEEFAKRCAEVEKNRQAVRAFIIERWCEHGSPKAVVFCQQEFEWWLKAKLPVGIMINHYGNVAGTNRYEDVSLQFLVGRAIPGPQAVESAASTMSGLQVPSVIGNSKRFWWYPMEGVKIPMRNGSVVIGRRHTHPDPLCRAFIRSILDGELLNAFGRARPWGRIADNPLSVILMLDERVPGAVLDTAEYWKPEPMDVLIENGVLLRSASDLMRLWPELFTSRSTVGRFIQKALKPPEGWRWFRYRLKGRRRGPLSVGWYDPKRIGDPQAWLNGRLGGLLTYNEDPDDGSKTL